MAMRRHESLVGKKLGDYEILRELGRGGMGAVYLAREGSLQRDVALKILPPSLAENETFIRRFIREARSAAQLSHPNTVHVYAVRQTDGAHYIAMEYVEGPSLRDHIRAKGRLGEREALGIARQVAKALHDAHRKGIVHRDIKPQNILLTEEGQVA